MQTAIKVPYFHGPLDGEFETVKQCPSEGEKRHRLVGGKYVEYEFSPQRGGFLAVQPGVTVCVACGRDITVGYSNSGRCVTCAAEFTDNDW